MFGAPGLGFTEIMVLGILALLVLGPKDLPLMLRRIGRWTARLRGMAAEFRSGFDELARQAELDELRREVDALRNDARAVHDSIARPLETLTRPTALSPIPHRAEPAPDQDDEAAAWRAPPDDDPQPDIPAPDPELPFSAEPPAHRAPGPGAAPAAGPSPLAEPGR